MIVNNYDNNEQINNKVIVVIVVLGNIFKVMFESINAVGFFENLWGFIPYWGTNESAFCPMLVFETDKSISDNYFLLLNCLDKLIQKLH